jgi:putative pyruvate formate lyase activating enzyme
MKKENSPGYVGLLGSGELRQRAHLALTLLQGCRVCPSHCGVRRLQDETGACGIGRLAVVASFGAHFGEEECLRGSHGSGTIFFAGCGLKCAFCQNWEVSHLRQGEPVTAGTLAAIMLDLQAQGCHNINWVTPTHVIPQALEALYLAAREGLRLPIVYNSSGYDRIETLQLLEDVVDIYLPDFKFWDAGIARRFTEAGDYPEVARQALAEMHRQVGDLTLNHEGMARRGLLVRHLVMPQGLAGTSSVCSWLASTISPRTCVNIMAQYHPAGLAGSDGASFGDIARPVTPSEARLARDEARVAGLTRLHGS